MTDVFDARKRSKVMSAIRSKGNLSTELKLLTLFRANKIVGWRRHYRLFGNPDFAFPGSDLAIFVDGCFWHGCIRCRTIPVSNRPFWRRKIAKNQLRDKTVGKALRARGWTVLRVWEHELKKGNGALNRIRRALAEAERQ